MEVERKVSEAPTQILCFDVDSPVARMSPRRKDESRIVDQRIGWITDSGNIGAVAHISVEGDLISTSAQMSNSTASAAPDQTAISIYDRVGTLTTYAEMERPVGESTTQVLCFDVDSLIASMSTSSVDESRVVDECVGWITDSSNIGAVTHIPIEGHLIATSTQMAYLAHICPSDQMAISVYDSVGSLTTYAEMERKVSEAPTQIHCFDGDSPGARK
jgi:hypothetical protein